MKVVSQLLFILIFSLSPLCLAEETSIAPETKVVAVVASPAEKMATKMTIEEKVGQLFLLGFGGTKIDKQIESRIIKIKPGGLIFFKRNLGRNPESFTRQLQKLNATRSSVPLITAIDEEGGLVARIRTSPPLPSALALGRISNTKSIYSLGSAIGNLLHGLGFNLNLAPVLDISNPATKSFIGNRSFGLEPSRVSSSSLAFAQGLQSEGVLATAKHFPGHGNSNSDSHLELPVNEIDYDALMAKNVAPYKKLINESAISAIMVAHVMYPKIDPAYPATYSKKIIQILRDELKYSGLIFTDDIQMMGANIFPSIRERAIQAFLAGNDMIMIAWNYNDQLEAYNGMVAAVRSGRVTEDRLNESLSRILEYKHKFKLFDGPDRKDFSRQVSSATDKRLRHTIDGITSDLFSQEALRNGPADLSNSSLPLLAFGADASFLNAIKHFSTWKKTKCYLLKKNTPFDKLVDFEKRGHDFVGVFYVTGSQSAAILNKMPSTLKGSFIVVNTLYPGALENSSAYRAVFEIPTRNTKTAELLLDWMKTVKDGTEADITSN